MRTLAIACAYAVGLCATAGAPAQDYPAKPVRVVIPISAGSGLDIIGRWVSQKLSVMWGQPVVVDNRPGGGGSVGTAVVAKSATDGYTLLIAGANAHAINSVVYAKLPYNTLEDFIEIAPLAALYQVLVISPSAGVKSVSALVAAAKTKPGQITFASPGTGTGVHFTGEKFRLGAGIDVVHVPYKGGPEAMNDVMMGRVTFWIPSIGTALPFIQSGRLLALGVTSATRSNALPDVPTIGEAGLPGFENALWFGMWVPARVPGTVVELLARDAARARSAPDVREQFRSLVAEPMEMTRAEFSAFVRRETKTAAILARAVGIKPQ